MCRALVTEAVELSSFMEKVASSNSQVETDSELGQLDVQDWVRTPICDQNISTKYLLTGCVLAGPPLGPGDPRAEERSEAQEDGVHQVSCDWSRPAPNTHL